MDSVCVLYATVYEPVHVKMHKACWNESHFNANVTQSLSRR